MSLLTRSKTSGNTEAKDEHAPPAIRSHRSRTFTIMAAGFVLLCGFVGWYGVQSFLGSTEVLAVTNTVYRGEIIEREDLGVVSLPADSGLDLVSVADADSVVGTRAAMDMPAGSPVNAEAVISEIGPPPGQVWVGATLPASKYPMGQVTPGSKVQIVSTPGDGDEVTATQSIVIAATIIDSQFDDISGDQSFTLAVTEAQAVKAAELIATNRVALTLMPSSVEGAAATQEGGTE